MSSASSSTWVTCQPEGTRAAKYGIVICWKLRNRDLRALRISSEDAVIKRSFGMAFRTRPDRAESLDELLPPLHRHIRTHTTATLTLWIGGSESKRQSHCSPPSLPIHSWPVVVPK